MLDRIEAWNQKTNDWYEGLKREDGVEVRDRGGQVAEGGAEGQEPG